MDIAMNASDNVCLFDQKEMVIKVYYTLSVSIIRNQPSKHIVSGYKINVQVKILIIF